MPRKNARVGMRKTRREFRQDTSWSAPLAAMSLDYMVVPDGKCVLRRSKDRYDTEAKALKALKQVRAKRRFQPESRVEKRVYECPSKECGGWHLSSRSEFDEQQARLLFEQRNPQEGTS